MVVGMRAAAHKPVLVVEDNTDTREVIKVLLSLEGYAVVTAADGAEAMAKLRGGLDPCLIILDLMMPVKDGYQFRREQMADPTLQRIPVIVCSGDGNVAYKAESLQATAYYHKPIEPDELIAMVARHC